MPIPHCLAYCSFISPSTFTFFLKTVFTTLHPRYFYINFEVSLSVCTHTHTHTHTKSTRVLIKIVLDL